MSNSEPKESRTICGGKRKDGKPCTNNPVRGSKRCRMHGGTNPGGPEGNKKAEEHGIYLSALGEQEQSWWDLVKLGEVNDELRLAKIKLRRAVEAQRKSDEGAANPVVEESIEKSDADGREITKVKKVRRKTDFDAIIDRFLGRIGNLEKIKMELESITGGDQLDSDELDEEFL